MVPTLQPSYARPFTPSDKAELKNATDMWVANVGAAEATYGHIGEWNTRLITDMSYLFCGSSDHARSGCDTSYANFNADIGDYWEWSDAGSLPIDLSNEAYKLGVNYIIYSMTH